jgi:hypothetical protein
MKKTILLSGFLFAQLCLHAQENLYIKESIPAALLAKSNSVKRYSKDEFIITDESHAIYKHKEIVTILNQEAEDELNLAEYTDSFDKLEDVQITLYNKFGIAGKTIRKKDLMSHAVGGDLMNDAMLYYIGLSAAQTDYPVTIEKSYTTKYSGLLNYPSFDIISPQQSVEQALYTVTVPKDLGLRFKNQSTDIKPVITEENNKTTYNWEVKNLPAMPGEVGGVRWESRYPKVWLAPKKFKMNDYSGDMTTWGNFGKWDASLCEKANDLPMQAKARLNELVSGAKNDHEKINILYNYLQDNFRYVSIQLGIGGFKPFPASFTDQKKYGDCKGLSNYMHSCLAAVGIKSYMALINAHYNAAPVDPDFPINRFNHMILCVPLTTDTVWLECTSTTNACGVLGSFTENRNALLLTENGGVLVKTPFSKASQNTLSVTNVVELTENGIGGKMNSSIATTGDFRSNFIQALQNATTNDQKSYLVKTLELPSPDEFDFVMPANIKQQNLVCSMNVSFEKIAAFKSGSKIFLNRQIQKSLTFTMPDNSNRTQDYYFEFPFQKTDSTVYILPEGFTIEHLPEPANFSCKYGTYVSKCVYDKTKRTITSTASMELSQYKIPPADYMETNLFLKKIVGDGSQKIIVKTP